MSTMIPWKRQASPQNGAGQPTPLSRMRWDWDRMFDRFFDDVWAPRVEPSNLPLDVTETDDEIRIRAEVPGIDPENLEIQLSGEVLTLAGSKLDEEESSKEGRSYSERVFGSFQRALQLPCPVDPDKVKAQHKHGVVTITLQKAEAVRPKRIQVKAS